MPASHTRSGAKIESRQQHNLRRILEFLKKSQGKEEDFPFGVLNPKDEEYVVITTMENFRPDVAAIVKSTDDYIWRVQVRCGLVTYKGKELSATAVIGVEFNAGQIEAKAPKA